MSKQTVLGAYTLLEEIETGPITAVYKAQHTVTQQTVALKLLPADIGNHPATLKRLNQWAIQMQTPPHPGVPPLIALEQEGDQYFAIFPLLEGETLRHRIGSLDQETVNQLLLRLTDILKALHQFGIWHHNIKPENVLFDEQGKIFLTDVGLSTILRPRLDDFSGSPDYLSPEQRAGEAANGRSDFYSLGVVLYEMLAGERPYSPTDPVPSLHEQNPQIPLMYDHLIARLCARDKNGRPADCHEAGDLVVATIAQIEGWPNSADADYADDLPIFDSLTLYNKVPPSREQREAERTRIENLQREEEHHSQKRMERFMAIEEERQARVQEELNTQRAQERTVYIIFFAFILIVVLGIVGYYLTQLFGA